MFRVVPDQLRVSEGWVRCGQCAEVFDATQNMVPSGDEAPASPAAPTPVTPPAGVSQPPAPATPSATPPVSPPQTSPAEPPLAPPPSTPAPSTPAPSAAPTSATTPPAGASTPPPRDAWSAAPQAPTDLAAAAAAQQDDDVDVDAMMRPAVDDPHAHDDWRTGPQTDPRTAATAATHDDTDPDDIDTLPPPELDFPPVPDAGRTASADVTRGADPGPDADPDHGHAAVARPSFLQDDLQPSVWQRPMVRVALVVTLVVLLALLGMQLLVKERDRVAAVQPAMRPMLEALCTVAGCSIAPLRQIESIVIDSSSFSRVRGDDYRLGFSLKNTAAIDVAMPAVELSLTDPQDQPVIRRVILPAEFGARSDALAGASVWSGSLALTVQADASVQRVAGYRLLAFYP